jgi:hypothetical protein
VDTAGGGKGEGNASGTFYVSTAGVDTNQGTQSSPFATVQHGIDACRTMRRSHRAASILKFASASCSVVVSAGDYELKDTLALGPADSNLQIRGVGGADGSWPVLSGGQELTNLQWSKAGGFFPPGVVVAALPSAAEGLAFTQLFVDGSRAVRARHPNANPGGYYTTGRWATPTGWFASAKSWVRSPTYHASRVVSKKMVRNTTRYSDFMLGYDGPVRQFNPPAAYWAVENPPAGGGCKYEVPVAVVYNEDEFVGAIPPSKWSSNVSGAVVHAFHKSYWGSWMFEVVKHSPSTSTLSFGRGGFQEARGSCGKGGHDYYIDNVMELLDMPTEWWLDTASNKLYYFPNATDGVGAGGAALTDNEITAAALDHAARSKFVASRLKTLVNINGTQATPVQNVDFTGVALAHARPTFLDDYEV